MEANCKVRHIRMSPRKLRVVANMVRGEDVESAMISLRMMPKKAARIIGKAVVSATANAADKAGDELDLEALRIKSIYVDGGPMTKRWMPRAMGRANRINHRTSHLTVVVSDES